MIDERSYHLVGIGGIGMSAIARLLLARGARVSGSDVRTTALIEALVGEGARVVIGHRSENLERPNVVVVSSAIEPTNPEFTAALERGIRVLTRGEMLAELARSSRTIAIAGTHGKTTTTAMTAAIFEAAELDPTVVVGGLRVDTGRNATSGKGTWFITESDESDGSFLHLDPTIAVVTNIENDHIASDAELPHLLVQFAKFVARVPSSGRAVIGIDNPASAVIAANATAPVTTFSTRTQASLWARDARYDGLRSSVTVCEGSSVLGTLELQVPGEINVLNALAAIGVARAVHLPFDVIAQALNAFRGVRRRFEIVGTREDLTIIDDYAHHPTAIAQTIAAARAATTGRIVVAFQPHRYSRTQYLAGDFARALAAADDVILTPIYAASEAPIAGVSERSIGEPLAAFGSARVHYVDDVQALAVAVPEIAGEHAMVLMLGAGSISSVAHAIGATLADSAVAAR